MAAASMAGQYETFLDIIGEEALVDAVYRCWASLDSPRIRTYLSEHGIDPAQVSMAVVVQRLVTADVAGVLFTANPQMGTRDEMLVEASWGLGESVVSGRVQPDVLRLEHETGRVLAATIADKRVHLAAGAHEEQLVEESRRRLPCLRGRDVHRLWQVGRRVAEHFGSPQDIEWAIHDGELYLLQSRPITTLEEAEAYEEVLRGAREQLRHGLSIQRGPWALHNLAETLAHPTPLTWSVISRFMSGAGGFGAMYRQVGFSPSPAVERDGFLDLVGGRIYMDASRAPEMFFENFPFAYDLEELKRSPDASQTPPTVPIGKFTATMSAARRLGAVNAALQKLSIDFDRKLNAEIFPAFAEYCAKEKLRDLKSLSVEELVDHWRQRETRVLDEFAPQSLLPSLISGMALAELRTFLAENFWQEDPDDLSQLISAGGPPNRTVVADAELYEVGKRTRSLDKWIEDHGHRAAGEFDLAARRWREIPNDAADMAARLAGGDGPLERHRAHGEEINRRIGALRDRLASCDRAEFDRRVDLVRRYVAFREDGKDFLMLGYDLLRDLALEAGRRLEVGEDIFYLTREDIFDAVRVGFAPHHLIEQRKKTYRAEARLTLPRVIDEEAIDTLGDPPDVKTAGGYKAFPVSSGEAAGPARIRRSPTEAGELGSGYILVCPSTDPSWTPLFVNAAGLVLECGGTLSHGAVVAREMGLPAVVLPEATRMFAEGEEIRVDGRRGAVGRVAEETSAVAPEKTVDPEDVHIAHAMIPPPEGRKDRSAAKIRNITAIIWAVYLAAAFLLPDRWLYQPSLTFLDWFLWPIARGLGRPAVVAIVAAGLAAITLILQKFITDYSRLLEAKRRAAALTEEAQTLPKDSPRRSALLRLAGPVQWRTLAAAMAPIGILLGPMVMTFTWFTERVDPAAWNAGPGASAQVIATVDGEFTDPITITAPAPLTLDALTPPVRSLPPYRQTLQRLLPLLRQPAVDPKEPWEVAIAPDTVRSGRDTTADDLQAYLDAGIKPQGITWQLHAPEGLTGRFPVSVKVGDKPPMVMDLVLGNQYPPAPATLDGPRASPVKQVQIVYAHSSDKRFFWEPLLKLKDTRDVPSRLAAMEVGWLVLYILAYLPTLFLLRTLLKLA
jgi:pyruvate,water dikinase